MPLQAYDASPKISDGERKVGTGAGHEHQRCRDVEAAGESCHIGWRKLAFDENLQ